LAEPATSVNALLAVKNKFPTANRVGGWRAEKKDTTRFHA